MALGGFFSRLKEGLSRSTQKLTEGITAVFKKRRLDEAALEELEELLISADLGTGGGRGGSIADFRRTRFGKEVTDEEIRQALAEEIAAILAPVARPLATRPGAEAACGAGGRRERHRQDDDDRQAGAALSRAGHCGRCWWPAIRSAPRRWSSCRSGASAPVRR